MPEKLRELQRLWLDRGDAVHRSCRSTIVVVEKMNLDTAGRAGADQGKYATPVRRHGTPVRELRPEHQEQVPTPSRLEIEVPKSGAEGVIIAQGANIGGWSLYAKGGKLKYCYNVAGVNHYFVESADPLPAGEHQVRMEFAYAGGGLGKGGQATLTLSTARRCGRGCFAIPMTFR